MADSAPQVVPAAVAADTKEKEAQEKAAKDAAATPAAAPPEPTAGITRTFTTHAGETVTVAELPNATKHEDPPATVPEAEPTKPQEHIEKVEPVKETSTVIPLPPTKTVTPASSKASIPATIPENGHSVVKTQDYASKITPDSAPPETPPAVNRGRSFTVAEKSSTSLPASTATKPAPIGTATIKSSKSVELSDSPSPLWKIDYEIGIFSQYVAKKETALNVQVIFRNDGVTSQAFVDDRGAAMFTLERKPSLLEDRELRDKSRMYLLGIHKRRYRRPKQWCIRTGSDHGMKISSSWKHRNKDLVLSFTNQLDGQHTRMLLEGGRLHIRNDRLSPVVAIAEPTSLRVSQGLDLTIACVASAVHHEMREVKRGGSSIMSVKGSFKKRFGKLTEDGPHPMAFVP